MFDKRVSLGALRTHNKKRSFNQKTSGEVLKVTNYVRVYQSEERQLLKQLRQIDLCTSHSATVRLSICKPFRWSPTVGKKSVGFSS